MASRVARQHNYRCTNPACGAVWASDVAEPCIICTGRSIRTRGAPRRSFMLPVLPQRTWAQQAFHVFATALLICGGAAGMSWAFYTLFLSWK